MPSRSSHARQPVLFELAVYRLSKDRWRTEGDERQAKSVNRLLDQIPGDPPYSTEDVEHVRGLAERLERRPNWEYNEIIGWIRLIHDGPGLVVKAYLFAVASPRRLGLPRRSYSAGFHPYPFAHGNPTHKLFERWVSPSDTSASVFEALRASLDELTRPGHDLKDRTIDLEAFATIGPYVDWMAALRQSSPHVTSS